MALGGERIPRCELCGDDTRNYLRLPCCDYGACRACLAKWFRVATTCPGCRALHDTHRVLSDGDLRDRPRRRAYLEGLKAIRRIAAAS